MSYQIDATGAVRDQALVGDTVVLADDDCTALVKSTLTGGVLRLSQPKKAGRLVMCTLTNCVIDAVKPQRDYSLFTARFINCRFHGTFSGIDFGRSHNTERDGDFGAVEGCDFTESILDGCRFVNVEISTLQFPRRDHALLVEPYKRSADVSAITWPGLLGLYMENCTNKPDSFKALVMHIPSLARLVKCTEEEIRAAFENFGDVVI
jgi:hypothetical protein